MKFNDISKKHYLWLEQKGWNNTTALEAAGMISSEVGEATKECYNNQLTDFFKEEVADIILRTIGLIQRYNIDIDQSLLSQKEDYNQWVEKSNYGGGSILEDLALINGEVSLVINECRGVYIGENFVQRSMQVLLCVIDLSHRVGFSLESEVQKKIKKNYLKLHTRIK